MHLREHNALHLAAMIMREPHDLHAGRAGH
jgi:hypothetical protein